jgi:hypothetical protein
MGHLQINNTLNLDASAGFRPFDLRGLALCGLNAQQQNNTKAEATLKKVGVAVYVNLMSYIRFGNPVEIQIFYFYSLLQCYMIILKKI